MTTDGPALDEFGATGRGGPQFPQGDGPPPQMVDVANLVVENAADPIFVTDGEGRTLFANQAAERTFGWSRAELQGQVLHDVIHHRYPDGRPFPISECPLGHVFVTRNSVSKHEDVFFHRDGQLVHVACSNAPILRDGRMIGAVLIAVDITGRKEAEERRQVQLHELNHRVKNTLATVQAIVSQSLRNAGSPGQASEAIQNRLTALARAHDVLTREEWQGADLRDLAADVGSTFGDAGAARFRHAGPRLRLSPARALAFAMALHELATNATKYGALSGPAGEVNLDWSVEDGPDGRMLAMQWRESGGPPVAPPARSGFGTRLIEQMLAQDLDATATFDFPPEGLVFTLSAPLG